MRPAAMSLEEIFLQLTGSDAARRRTRAAPAVSLTSPLRRPHA